MFRIPNARFRRASVLSSLAFAVSAMLPSIAAAQAPTDNWRPSPQPHYGQVDEGAQPIPYREGLPIPEGYHVEQSPRYALVASGAALTSSLWAISTVTAIVLDKEKAQDGDPNFDDMYWPMFIPVAGPFAAIATADSSGTGAAILALDGAIQAAGLAMFIAGYAAPKKELMPDYELKIVPMASPETGGVSLSGSF